MLALIEIDEEQYFEFEPEPLLDQLFYILWCSSVQVAAQTYDTTSIHGHKSIHEVILVSLTT